MRLEFLGTMRAVTQSDRDWLRQHLWPNDHWKIWITWFCGQRLDDHFAKYYAAQLGHPDPPVNVGAQYCNVQVVTLVLGELCAHSIYSPIIDLDTFGYENVPLVSVWPPSRFDLDTERMPALDDKAVLWLHETFARESRKT
jgi:hypothetical protein